MSELQEGPLDIARNMDAAAQELDRLALGAQPGDDAAFSDLQEEAKKLEEGHPLLKQPVVVYGQPVHADFSNVISAWREVHASESRPEDQPELASQAGKYGGIMICEAYDSDTGKPAYRVAHVVHVDSSEMIPDGLGNFYQKHYMNYILAEGGEVVPTLPIDAHSLQDLEGDPVVAAVDKIVRDENIDNLQKIVRLGEGVNEILAAQEVVDLDLDHQRSSYINSFGLHNTARLVIDDVLLCEEDELDDDVLLVKLDDTVCITPQMFEIATGYERVGDTGEALTGPPELYARTTLSKSAQLVLMALKNVLSVELP